MLDGVDDGEMVTVHDLHEAMDAAHELAAGEDRVLQREFDDGADLTVFGVIFELDHLGHEADLQE